MAGSAEEVNYFELFFLGTTILFVMLALYFIFSTQGASSVTGGLSIAGMICFGLYFAISKLTGKKKDGSSGGFDDQIQQLGGLLSSLVDDVHKVTQSTPATGASHHTDAEPASGGDDAMYMPV